MEDNGKLAAQEAILFLLRNFFFVLEDVAPYSTYCAVVLALLRRILYISCTLGAQLRRAELCRLDICSPSGSATIHHHQAAAVQHTNSVEVTFPEESRK